MPRRNVFIRDKNLSLWDALENKSEWVNNSLEGAEVPPEFWQTQIERSMIYDPKLGRMVPND